MRPSSEQEDNPGAFVDHVLCEEHTAEEEQPIRAERVVLVRQTTLRDAIVGILGLMEDAVTAFVSTESQNGVKMADSLLKDMIQRLLNKTLDEKQNSVEFKDHLLRKIEKETPSRQQVKRGTQAMSEDQELP